MYEINVNGIPAKAEVTSYLSVKGSFSHNAPSDLDYYGYTEMEFDLYDRKGYRAKWLDKIADDHDLWADIEEQIQDKMAEEAY